MSPHANAPRQRWRISSSLMPDTRPAFGQGAIYYASGDDGLIHAVDYQQGTEKWTAAGMGSPPGLESPVLHEGTLYVTSDAGTLYALDPHSGEVSWKTSLQGAHATSPPFLAPAPDAEQASRRALYVLSDRQLWAVYVDGAEGAEPSPRVVYTAPAGEKLSTHPPVYFAEQEILVIGTGRGLAGLDVAPSGSGTWKRRWSASLGGATTPPVAGLGKVFVGTSRGTMAIVDAETGMVTESEDLGSQLVQRLAVYQGKAFVPTESGEVWVLNATTAVKESPSSLRPGGQVTTPIVIADGTAYYGSGDGNVYAFDPAGDLEDVVSFGAGGPVTALMEAGDGNVYLAATNQQTAETELVCARFADLLHEFSIHAEYLADFVADAGGSPQQVPAYQVHITLYDQDKNLRPRESVKIWSEQPAEIRVGGRTYQVSASRPLALLSDAAGRIALSLAPAAPRAQAASGLSASALQVWAGFMEIEERILVFPDQSLHSRLSTVTGNQLQGLRPFDQKDPAAPAKTTLLPKGFQGEKGLGNANTVARSVRNIMAMKKGGASKAASGAAPAAKYLAFPDTLTGVSYWAANPVTTRPTVSGPDRYWTLDLGGADLSFQAWTSAAEVDEALGIEASPSAIEPSFLGDLEHFAEKVVRGAEKIAKMGWQEVEGELSTIIQTAEATYRFTVDTVEKAALVVVGIFKSLVEKLELILEALCLLLEWSDILDTHRALRTLVSSAFDRAASELAGLDAKSVVAGWAGRVESELENLDTTLGAALAGHEDPAKLFARSGSASSIVRGNWLLSKVTGHAFGPGGSVSLEALPAPASGAGSIGAAVETFVSQVAEEAETVGDDLAGSLRNAVHGLEDVLLDPEALRGATFSRLTQDVEKLAQDLLKVAEGAADDFVDLLQKMLTQIPDLLKEKIRIPLISDLYHLLTGDDLTILDLTALLVAVPTTVLYKGLEGHSPAGPIRRAIPSAPAPRLTEGAPQPLPKETQIALGFANLATGGIFAVLDAAQTLVGSNAFTNGSVAASLAVRQGLTLVPVSGLERGSKQVAALVFWSYHCFPVVWNTVLALPSSAEARPVASFVTSAFGAGNVIGSGLMAGLYPDLYFDGGARLAQNDLFAFSQWTKVFRVTGDLRVLAVLAVVDAFLDAGSAALGAETA